MLLAVAKQTKHCLYEVVVVANHMRRNIRADGSVHESSRYHAMDTGQSRVGTSLLLCCVKNHGARCRYAQETCMVWRRVHNDKPIVHT